MSKNRQSIRLKGYDYSSARYYFVPICTYERQKLFGNIINTQMILNECGYLAQTYWQEIPKHFDGVDIDTFVIMPDHMHGIIVINRRGEALPRPYNGKYEYFSKISPQSKSLGVIVGSYKSIVAKWIRINQKTSQPVWQRNYYKRIIRNDAELSQIRKYLQTNPLTGEFDENNV